MGGWRAKLFCQNENGMRSATKYATTIVVAHLLVNIAHGLAHRELRVGLAPSGLIFVIVVVLILPLVATGLVWTAENRLGLILLSFSMFGSLLFGLYHHFLSVTPDHVRLQPSSPWGITFVLTAYLLLITEAIGTYVGVHFLRIAKERSHEPLNADSRGRTDASDC
jgi:hypothetical protein